MVLTIHPTFAVQLRGTQSATYSLRQAHVHTFCSSLISPKHSSAIPPTMYSNKWLMIG